jgi:putative ABC transport system permease protein
VNKLFQNNNNAVIKQLSKTSLKTSKLRNRLAGAVIALSAFLLVLVSTFAYNAIMELKNLTHYQALFENADIQVLDSLKRNPDVEVYGLSQQAGMVKSGGTSLSLLYADEKTMELSNVRIKTGLLPVKANQISIEKGYIDSVYPGVQIGDTITLTYRNEVSKEMKMDSFIITSFLETGAKNDKRRKAYNAIVSQAFIESDLALSSVYPSAIIKVTNANRYSNVDLKAKIKEIGNLAGLPEQSININNTNIDSNNASPETVATVFAVFLVVITACSLVIYNIFYIAIIRKVNEYGQLRTIGTTKRQIKKIVMGEGKLLCFQYIPIGILLGCGVSYLLRPSMYFVVPSFILALCGGCITFITVMLALRKPAKIAAEVSPMEAIRYTGFYGALKGKKNMARILTPYTLGKMYYTGNKKKTAVTLLSLAFSGILFIAAASLMSSADPVKRAAQRFPYGGEYIIQLNNDLLSPTTSYSDLQIDNPLSDELKAKITAINGVDSVEIHKYIRGKLVGINHDDEMIGIDNIRKNDVSKFEKYLIQGTLPNSSGKEILVNCSTSTYEYFGHIYQPGDIIMMYLFDGDTQITKEFTVSGVIDNKHSSDTLFLPDSVIDELMIQNCNLSFEIISHQGYSANIEILLKALITSEEKLEFISMKEQTELYRSAFYMLNVIVYTFIALIGCFSMVNLINTIITNIVSRKNELSIMQAVGLSKKQLMKMLNTENGYLIFGSFIVSIFLGSTLGYFICKAAGNTGGLSYIQYRFPFWIIVIYFLLIITLQGITIGCIGIGMRKNSLIERLSEI